MDRRHKTLWQLVGRTIDALLITSPENVRYLSGFDGTEGTLLLSRTHSFFFTDGRYVTQARQQVYNCSVKVFTEKWSAIGKAIKKIRCKRLGYESRHMTVAMLNELKRETVGVELCAYSTELDKLRLIKDRMEIAVLRQAACIAAQALEQVIPMIVPGVREYDIAAELEYRMRQQGAQGAAFPTIVASGVRSALPHGTAGNKTIREGEFVTIDYGVRYQGYCSDETCTFVIGKPTARQKQVYDAVRGAHDKALRMVAPGTNLKKIDAAARSYLERRGYGRYFIHGTGHGVGLCVHEPPVVSPRATMACAQGMVFTIEPGVYVPGWGGIRIEDMVLVTRNGAEVLTQFNKRLRCLE